MNKGFIIDIAPLARLPMHRQQHFSYLWEKELPEGTLVDIPLFRRNVQGIVLGSRSDFHRLGNIRLKKINSIIEEHFLTGDQLKLANFISNYYICPLGIVLKFFIPKRIKQRQKIQSTKNQQITKEIKLTKEQQNAISQISNLEPQVSKYLLFGPASSGKTEVYMNAIAKLKAKSEKFQALVLLPELTLTPQALERYGAHFKPEEIVLIHSKLSKGQLYSNWQKIKSGEAKIIIGSRMAIFAPFKNLGLIAIDEAQDMSFKQWDMSPKYDARKIGEKLSELNRCPLVLGSATPRAEDYYKALQGKYKLLELPKLNIPNSQISTLKSQVDIVDMRKERWKNKNKNIPIISSALKSEIAYALKHKQQSILFINRRGMSSFSVCVSCKSVLKCPQCQRALVYKGEGNYVCLHCNFKSDAFISCPGCQGIIFKNVGLGTQKIEKEVSKEFPGAKIKRVDFDSMAKSGAQEELYRDFSEKKIDILIGTQMITKGWDLPDVALIGIIDADSLFSVPDFMTDEKAFQNLMQLAGRTGRIGSKLSGRTIIQTYHPENPAIQSAAKMDYLEFYRQEITERKALSNPPFSQIIKLVFQDESLKKVEKISETAYQRLTADSENEKNVRISEPYNPLVDKIRKKYRKQIIIKITGELSENLQRKLASLEKGWLIDVDPISIA